MLVLEIPGPVTKGKKKRAENAQPARHAFKALSTQVLRILLNIAKRFPGIH
jgi:hypothetical protein